MNRRSFLSTLTALAATATLDPERLLWVPGQRKIFIPTQPKGYEVVVQMMQHHPILADGYLGPVDFYRSYMLKLFQSKRPMDVGDFVGIDDNGFVKSLTFKPGTLEGPNRNPAIYTPLGSCLSCKPVYE